MPVQAATWAGEKPLLCFSASHWKMRKLTSLHNDTVLLSQLCDVHYLHADVKVSCCCRWPVLVLL